jgi:hypothetical protein
MNEIVVVTRGLSLSQTGMGWDDVYQSIIGLRLLHASARARDIEICRINRLTLAMSGIDEGWRSNALESIEGLDAAFLKVLSQHNGRLSHG